MKELINVLFGGMGNFSNLINEIELIGIKYKDSDGVHDVVFNEKLWNCKKECSCDKESCDCCHTCENKLSVAEMFLQDECSLRNSNDIPTNFADLSDGSYVYLKSNKDTALFGIFSHIKDDVIYFYATICAEDGETFVSYNDCCFGLKEWNIYSVNADEEQYMNELLEEDGWKFDIVNKKFNIVRR